MRRPLQWSSWFAALALPAVITVSPPLRANGEAARWSVAMYLNGDNNLERHIVGDFNEIARLSERSDTHVRIDVQLDRTGRYFRDLHAPDSPSTGLFRLSDPTKSTPVPLGPHRGMADARNLSSFLETTAAERSFRHRALIVGAHGDGPRAFGGAVHLSTGAASIDPADSRGILFDESDNRYLSIDEFSAAIDRSGKLDVLGLDACLMATVEVLAEVAPITKWVVASEHEEIAEGWDHSVWARKVFLHQGNLTPEQLAGAFLDSFELAVETAGEQLEGRSAVVVRTAAMPELVRNVNELAGVLLEAQTSSAWPEVVNAMRHTTTHCPPLGTNLQSNTVDVGCLSHVLHQKLVEGNVLSLPMLARVERVVSNITALLCVAEHGASCPTPSGGTRVVVDRALGARLARQSYLGVAIYFPASRASALLGVTLDNYRAGRLRFFQSAPKWLALIDAYQRSIRS